MPNTRKYPGETVIARTRWLIESFKTLLPMFESV